MKVLVRSCVWMYAGLFIMVLQAKIVVSLVGWIPGMIAVVDGWEQLDTG